MRLWRCCLASAPLARTRQQPAQHRPLPPQSRRPPCQMVRGSPPRPDHPLIRLQLWAGRRPHRRVQELWSLTSSIPLCPYRSHDRLFTRSPCRSRQLRGCDQPASASRLERRSLSATWIARAFSKILRYLFAFVVSRSARSSAATPHGSQGGVARAERAARRPQDVVSASCDGPCGSLAAIWPSAGTRGLGPGQNASSE